MGRRKKEDTAAKTETENLELEEKKEAKEDKKKKTKTPKTTSRKKKKDEPAETPEVTENVGAEEAEDESIMEDDTHDYHATVKIQRYDQTTKRTENSDDRHSLGCQKQVGVQALAGMRLHASLDDASGRMLPRVRRHGDGGPAAGFHAWFAVGAHRPPCA